MRRNRRLPAAIVAAAAALGGALAVAAPSQAAPVTGARAAAGPLVTLPASAAPVIPAGAKLVGALTASSPIHLVFTLKARDQGNLSALLAGQANPDSPSFHRFLQPGQFAAMFGATKDQVATVDAALKSVGLTPGAVSANSLSIPVTASAPAVGAALHTSLVQYRLTGGRLAYANKTAPVLPAAAAALVNGIVGLNDLYPRQKMSVVPAGPKAAKPSKVTPAAVGPQPCASATDAGTAFDSLTADQLAAHYGLSPLYSLGDEGQGQRVAIVEFEPNLAGDIAAYESCYGISTTVNYVTVDGGAGTGAGSGESALDIEDVAGLAPKATLDVYQAPNTDAGNYDLYQSIISADTAKTVTSSWGVCEAYLSGSDEAAQELLFEQAAAQGQTVLAAAGDTGSTECWRSGGPSESALNALTPGSLPYVVSVGGTTVSPGSEVTWNNDTGAGGGGISDFWCMPSYQHQTALPGLINAHSVTAPACTANGGYRRQVPDISADADPFSGYVVDYDGAWTGIGGTSAATPLLAAVAALTNASPFCAQYGSGSPGLQPAGLYAMAASDHAYLYPAGGFVAEAISDVTSGTNDWSPSGYTGGLFPAGHGYDEATGLGVPLVTGLNGESQPSTYYPGLAALMCRQYSTRLQTSTVTGVTPATGKAGQAATVTVHGTGFLPIAGADVAVIGSVRVPATCPTTTACTVKLPARGPSTVDVRISAEDFAATPVTTADHFRYLAAPTVTSVSPASGPAKGGTKVTIHGTNFTSVKLVQFGTKKAVGAKVISPTEITAATPAAAKGAVHVIITTASGANGGTAAASKYTYK